MEMFLLHYRPTSHDLLEILDDRNTTGATLVTGQLPVGKWHSIISDTTVADALLDRWVHNAYRIELKGESMRKKTLSWASRLARSLTAAAIRAATP